MKTRNIAILTAVAALILCLSGLPALSQEKAADNMQIVLEKLKADKKLLVAQNMGLTESEAKAFWPVYESYQKDLMAIRARTGALIEDYAKNYNSMTPEAAKKLTDAFVSLKTDHAKLISSYVPRLRKVLPEVKVARYLQIENKLNAILDYELAGAVPLVAQ
jgi:hypothetical protein